ncbi:MAG: DUF6515 family protein [Niabella sp.]
MKTRNIKYGIALLVLSVIFVNDTFAQRAVRRYPVGRSYSYHHGYRTRPWVSVGVGGFFGGYSRYYGARPRVSMGVMMPGIGVRIGTLPYGSFNFFWGGMPYYYFGGTFYRQSDNSYEVVEAPIGALVNRLPAGAEQMEINGELYYEYRGTYYQETTDKNGKRAYEVVGVDGKLDTDGANQRSYNNDPVYDNEGYDNEDVPVASAPVSGSIVKPEIGDVFEQLPKDCKVIAVDGKKNYVSPAGVYYKEINEDGKILYEVVRVN